MTPSQRPTAQDIRNHQDAPEVQDPMNKDIRANINMLDDGGKLADAEGHQPISWDIDPETVDILYCDHDVMMENGEEGPVNEFDYQAEQEEGGREYKPEGARTCMPVDADPPSCLHLGQFRNLSYLSYLKLHPGTHTVHSDQLHILWETSTPHPFLACTLLHHPWDKEIMFLEAQQVTKCAEAEAIHRRQLEIKKTDLKLQKADAEVLKKQSQVLMLQLRLAEFKKQSNHGHGADPSSSGADASLGSGYA
ncbi:hypothetical protein BDN67DRAFT_1016585 [Paxillus ammoniavirescens]|nr:hypothetical protein BDN67DRAFT_1016585 [Paxillus ammoniavirescens]